MTWLLFPTGRAHYAVKEAPYTDGRVHVVTACGMGWLLEKKVDPGQLPREHYCKRCLKLEPKP